MDGDAGGAKNLGGLISRDLAQAGAAGIAVHYNSDATRAAAEETVAAVRAAGAEAFAQQGDLTRPAEVAALFDAALAAAAVRDWTGARRLAFNRELSLAPGLEFAFAAESIAEPTQWRLQHDRHTLIVHLDGAMRRLDTRIEGAGRLRLPPAPGDLWLIPAGREYRGEALGGQIAYAELSIDPARFDPCRRAAAGLGARMKQRDPFVHGLAARLAGLSGADDELAAMLREALGQALDRMRATGAGPGPGPRPRAASRPARRRRR
ncbi:KR domain-containing protein [Lysobacter sp. BMK333-48F3]|uniref:KR domain-containing protein n=1 Tax=Lysobacter sp. BMK333-48F3 TaxID=2867962 RepID=UPI0031BAC40A